MATLDEQINNFLRDASWRIAELSGEIDQLKRQDKTFREQAEQRAELSVFMDLLYDTINPILNDYTFLKVDWTEREIIAEMEYLREHTQMAEIPYITFTGYSPTIIVDGGTGPGNPGGTFPPGTVGQILTYNASGDLIAVDFPSDGGMLTNETIDEYFA